MELSFSKGDGTAYQNIIIVGENGTGKTTILSTISSFLNDGSILPFAFIEYDLDGVKYSAVPISGREANGFHKRVNIATGDSEDIYRNLGTNPEAYKNDTKDIRYYGCVCSKARADYTTDKINSVGSSSIDREKHLKDEDEKYTSLKQLIVDIKSQDEHDYAELGKTQAQLWDAYKSQSRTYRFEKAFNDFFDSIQFKGIETADNEKKILFTKHGVDIDIDSLSTGEKQIVYRGDYLLRNSQKLYDGTIFIDELELSMHPLWQKRILKYFTDLFSENGTQKSQIFIASHSDFVVESALTRAKKEGDTLVIILKNGGGTIGATSIDGAQFVLNSITAAEVNYKAFNIYSTDLHIALYSELEGIARQCSDAYVANVHGIEKCDRFIEIQQEYQAHPQPKQTSFGPHDYNTLSTSIRNHIDHPDNPYDYDDGHLEMSTELMIRILKRLKNIQN